MNIAEEVAQLKQEKDAVILAHYYVEPKVQDLADYIGDSFKLAKLAQQVPNKVIVFAGVEFMGESAKLLSPEKTVLMPEPEAGCPMAHMVQKETIDNARAEYGDDLAVVCYVNSTAEMKTWSDVCVTSSNALKIVSKLPQHHILFIPDFHLGSYIAELLPDKHFIFNDGFCPIHEAIELREIQDLKAQYPNAKTLVHPECPKYIRDEADYLGSTSGIIEQAVTGDAQDYIIGTVVGVAHEIKQRTVGTGKRLHFPATTPRCVNMAKITPEKVRDCLRDFTGQVEEPANPDAARLTLTRMLELAR